MLVAALISKLAFNVIRKSALTARVSRVPANLTTLEEALADVDALLSEREVALAAIQAEVEDLKTERAGLTLAVARRRSGTAVTEPVPPDAGEVAIIVDTTPAGTIIIDTGAYRWLSRTDAALKMLEEMGGEATLQDLASHLIEAGRPGDKPHAVGAALSYLAREGKVHNRSRGLWKVGPKPSPVVQALAGIVGSMVVHKAGFSTAGFSGPVTLSGVPLRSSTPAEEAI